MQTFIFDIDGTLIDSVTMYLAGLQKTMRRHGREYAQDDLRFSNGVPSSDTMKKLGFTGDQIDPAIREWTKDSLDFAKDVHFFPGMQETLRKLDQTKNLAIVTSKNQDQFAIDDQRFGFSKLVDAVVTAGMAKRNKPYPDPLLLAMEKVGGDLSSSVYIGDTITDAKAAEAAHMAFALCTWTTPREQIDAPVYCALKKPEDLCTL